jgi:hypothetical protein
MRIFGGWCSDDGFEYFRLWLIGQGRVIFERAVTMPDSLAAVPAIRRLAGRRRLEWNDDEEWPEWETLDYIAARAYHLVTGTAARSCSPSGLTSSRSRTSRSNCRSWGLRGARRQDRRVARLLRHEPVHQPEGVEAAPGKAAKPPSPKGCCPPVQQ